jgi:hypothetical protein
VFRIDCDRYWSATHNQIRQVLEVQELFGQTYCRVWLTQQNEIVRLPADNLQPVESALVYSGDRIRYLAAAAKVSDALTTFVSVV